MLNEVSNEVRNQVANYKFNRKVFKGVNTIKVDGFTADTITIMGVEIKMNAGEWKYLGVTDYFNMYNDSYIEQYYKIAMLPDYKRFCEIQKQVNAANPGKGVAVGRRFDYYGGTWRDENGEPMNEAKWAEYKAWKAQQEA